MQADELITARYRTLEGVLDERQRRLYAAAEAKVLGHGGVKRVHEATGVARGSILAGLRELEQEPKDLAGDGRRSAAPVRAARNWSNTTLGSEKRWSASLNR